MLLSIASDELLKKKKMKTNGYGGRKISGTDFVFFTREMALPPVREPKVRQPTDFRNYGYGAPKEGEGGGKGKKRTPKLAIDTEPPKAVVPGFQYVSAPDGQVMLVPTQASGIEGMLARYLFWWFYFS